MRTVRGAIAPLVLLAACSSTSSPSPSPTLQADARQPNLALRTAAPSIAGAYRLTRVVRGTAAWRDLVLVPDGSFAGGVPCRVPACAAVRASGRWSIDASGGTLTLAVKGGASTAFALTVSRDGIEIADDATDEQLSLYAGACVAVSDCAGQPTGGGDPSCAAGTHVVPSCDSNVCSVACSDPATPPPSPPPSTDPPSTDPPSTDPPSTDPPSTDPPSVAGAGAHCGGFIANAPTCDDGLVCILGPIPDAGGTCEPEGTPPRCASASECLSGQSCVVADGHCGVPGRCQTRSKICPDVCGGVATVCGCDGRTYCNACFATNAGTSVAKTGPCAEPPTSPPGDPAP